MHALKPSENGLLIGLSLLMVTCLAQAQEQKSNAQAVPVVPAQLTSKQFDAWVHQQEVRIQGRGEDPKPLEDAVLNRLKAEAFVSDDSIESMVMTWISNESRRTNVPVDPVFGAHPNSHRVIDAVLSLIDARPNLAAYLYEQKAYLWSLQKDKQKEAECRTQARDLLTQVQTDVDRRLVYQTIQLADLTYDQGDIKKADDLYFRAFGYPWFRVPLPQGEIFKSLHVRAARGLIKTRKDDLTALKNTFFLPATLDEIGPELQAAIEAAEKKQPEKKQPQ